MKNILLLSFIFFIIGCYSSKDDCYYGMTTICFGEEYPIIAHYQKKESLGHTDVAQRWKDVVSCGGKYGDKAVGDVWRRTFYAKRGQGNPKDVDLQQRFDHCMEQKGYIFIDRCGRKNSKTDKGICNE